MEAICELAAYSLAMVWSWCEAVIVVAPIFLVLAPLVSAALERQERHDLEHRRARGAGGHLSVHPPPITEVRHG